MAADEKNPLTYITKLNTTKYDSILRKPDNHGFVKYGDYFTEVAQKRASFIIGKAARNLVEYLKRQNPLVDYSATYDDGQKVWTVAPQSGREPIFKVQEDRDAKISVERFDGIATIVTSNDPSARQTIEDFKKVSGFKAYSDFLDQLFSDFESSMKRYANAYVKPDKKN